MGHYGNLHHYYDTSLEPRLSVPIFLQSSSQKYSGTESLGLGLLWHYMSTLSRTRTHWQSVARDMTSDFTHGCACTPDIEKITLLMKEHTHLTWEALPWSDGAHQLLSRGEAPQYVHALSCLQYTMLSGQSVHVRGSKIDQKSWTTIPPTSLHSATSH